MKKFAKLFILVVFASWLSVVQAFAIAPGEALDDPVLESRARELSGILRCLVCQNQSIDDSDAPLARDLRLLVRERLVAGDTNQEILTYLVARYGEFVLLKPSFAWHTMVLWFGAPFAFLLGLFGVYRSYKSRIRNATITSSGLSDIEQEKLRKILEQD